MTQPPELLSRRRTRRLRASTARRSECHSGVSVVGAPPGGGGAGGQQRHRWSTAAHDGLLVSERVSWDRGLVSLGVVCAEKGFQLGDCASQHIVGATPHPPVGAGSLRPPRESPWSPVKRLKKGARFRVSSRDNPNRETPELDDIHETSRSGPDPLRTDCTLGAATGSVPRTPGDSRPGHAPFAGQVRSGGAAVAGGGVALSITAARTLEPSFAMFR